MAINERAKVILFKTEATEGVDASPAAADAILTRNFSATPLQVDALERNLDLPTVGGSAVAVTNKRQAASFEVELAGSGVATTAPKWMRLLQACGMAAPQALPGGTPTHIEQKFGVSPFSSGTLYHWYENQRRKALMTRGSFGMNFTAGQYPFANFSMLGLLPASNPFDEAAAPTPDFSAFQSPKEVNTENTDFTLDTYAAVLRSLTFDANVNVTPRNLVGSNRINRGNHGITGTITIEAPLVSAKNYLTTLAAGDEVALSLTHGISAGNIVKVDMAKVQLTGISQSNEDDVLMYALEFRANVASGSDDILITTQ